MVAGYRGIEWFEHGGGAGTRTEQYRGNWFESSIGSASRATGEKRISRVRSNEYHAWSEFGIYRYRSRPSGHRATWNLKRKPEIKRVPLSECLVVIDHYCTVTLHHAVVELVHHDSVRDHTQSSASDDTSDCCDGRRNSCAISGFHGLRFEYRSRSGPCSRRHIRRR